MQAHLVSVFISGIDGYSEFGPCTLLPRTNLKCVSFVYLLCGKVRV